MSCVKSIWPVPVQGEDEVSLGEMKRIYYLDVIRTMACMMVIMIHTSGNYVIRDLGSSNFWFANVLDSLSRAAVPLFVMVSGALFLDEDHEVSTWKIKKHICKLLLFFMFWSLLYCVCFDWLMPAYLHHEKVGVFAIFEKFIRGYHHLWFIYMLAGLYLLVPVLRTWIKKENVQLIRLFLLLSFFFNFLIPWLQSISNYYFENISVLLGAFDQMHLQYVCGYVPYFVLGWYLRFYDIKRDKMLYLIGTVSLIFSIVMTGKMSIDFNAPLQMYSNMSVNVLLYSIACFCFCKKAFSAPKHTKLSRLVCAISKYSLGIYGAHAAFITVLYEGFEKLKIDSTFFTIPVTFLCALLGSASIAWLLSKSKILRRVVV